MVVRQIIEPKLEPIFDSESFGYRLGRSAHHAVELCRQRCWKWDWVLDLNLKDIQERWGMLDLRRWLEAPVQLSSGELQVRTCGTSQGGVISPLLANVSLHLFVHWQTLGHATVG